VRPHLARSTAIVVPLRSGGGTRLKILEAMAMARPVVSTAIGAEGLHVAHGRDILIGDAPERLADHIVALARSPELGERLGTAARRLVVREYDWATCLVGLDEAYATVRADCDDARSAGRR
jgi:glycosyltransferase involved in cell wall biosynthesis